MEVFFKGCLTMHSLSDDKAEVSYSSFAEKVWDHEPTDTST
jgi:hypothetical protein